MRTWAAWLAALVMALGLAILATTPPAPRDEDTSEKDFSAARAMRDVAVIARQPHVTGSPEAATVRRFLAERLAGLGLTVSEQSGPLEARPQERLAKWSGDARPVAATNLVARLPGSDPRLPAVLLMAHYDSVWGSPGAADDGAGVAAILETVRALRAGGSLRRDLLVVFTDGEELGLDGARIFFASHPEARRVGAIVNLEARGGGGIASMFQTAPGNAAAIALYARAVDAPATSSLSAFIYSVLPNDTDLSVPLKGGWWRGAAYNIAFIGRSGLYHSPLATPANLDQGALQHMGMQTLALARALGNVPALPAQGEDAVFFDAFGLFTVHYAPWLGWLMLAIGGAGLASAWLRSPPGGASSGAARMGGFLVASGLLLYVLNGISGSPGEYYDRLAAIPKLTAMAALACLALAIALMAARQWSTRARIGAWVLLAVLGVAAQALAPTAAYILAVPVLLAGLVEAVLVRAPQAGRIAAILVAGLIGGYMAGLFWQVMQGVGPSMPMAASLPAAIAVGAFLPLVPAIARWRSVAGAFLLAALAMALWVRFDPVAPSVAVYASDKPG